LDSYKEKIKLKYIKYRNILEKHNEIVGTKIDILKKLEDNINGYIIILNETIEILENMEECEIIEQFKKETVSFMEDCKYYIEVMHNFIAEIL
jgi:hypothetical protein